MRHHGIWLWMALALAGCAEAPVTQSPAELRATHGFVHASLPGTGAADLRLRSIAKGEEYKLVRQQEHGAYAYGLWVPAGQYEAVGLLNPDGSKYLPVNVSQGRLTDMGGLVLLQIGGYESVLLPIRHAEITMETQQVTARLGSNLLAAEPLEWKPVGPPQAVRAGTAPTNMGLIGDLLMEYTRHVNKPPLNQQLKGTKTVEEFFRRAAAAVPPLTDEPGSDADGNLYYGAELGQIRVRSRDGQWASLDTGTLQTITAVEVHGRSVVAGTAQGQVRVSSDGRSWRRQFAFAAEEAVVDIDRIDGRWMVLTARFTPSPSPSPEIQIQTADLIKIYTAAKDDLAGLTLLREIVLPEKVFFIRGMGIRGQHTGGAYYLNVGSDLLRLDLATLQWSSTTPGHKVSGFNISPKTGVLTAYRQQGAFSKLHFSSDRGVTWLPADTPPYVFYDVYFESVGNGLATRWSTGAFTASIEFMKYDAAADRWQKTHDAPPGCVRILRDAENVQRFCLTSGNSILNYVDGKWVAEFAVN